MSTHFPFGGKQSNLTKTNFSIYIPISSKHLFEAMKYISIYHVTEQKYVYPSCRLVTYINSVSDYSI